MSSIASTVFFTSSILFAIVNIQYIIISICFVILQKIYASTVPGIPAAFGHAISGGLDIDGNKYPGGNFVLLNYVAYSHLASML